MDVANQRPFTRLAIVNRGEAAMRVVHAARELNEEREEQLHLIALYTEPEAQAMFVRRSDQGYCLGPATYTAPDGSHRAGYLDYGALERALTETEAEAAWVGWGFVAEHPAFAELCERLGVVFVGPSSRDDAAPGRQDPLEAASRIHGRPGGALERRSGRRARRGRCAMRETIGYPLMIKATAGGGGRGIRRVEAADQLAAAFERARAEAEQAFGDPTVLLEQLVTPARHIEVQAIADGAGGAWAVGVRDCSLQRRHQKVIEESAQHGADAGAGGGVKDAARRLVLEVGYRGAATVEFLYEPAERRFSFMEVNARLQVEHPVTEMTTGLDLVKLQLHVAAGGRSGEPPPATGHAIEARLNAEDPSMDFAPAPGRVELLNLPSGPGLRFDRGVETGDMIPPEFDSMIAKVIASAAIATRPSHACAARCARRPR